MWNLGPIDKYMMIVHTNKYAGNFEREMVAYVTGQFGECGVGSEQAVIFNEEVEEEGIDDENILSFLRDGTLSIGDDHGTQRPASIWAGRKGKYNSVAMAFEWNLTRGIRNFLEDRALRYGRKNGIKVEGFEYLRYETTVTPCDPEPPCNHTS